MVVAKRKEEPPKKGPIEKGFERIEPKVQSGQQSLSSLVDKAADKVQEAGSKITQRTGIVEQKAVNSIAGRIHSGSDYIRNTDVRKELDMAAAKVRQNPVSAVYVAAGVGAVLGLLLAVRRR